MNKTEIKQSTPKRKYTRPGITLVKLDNEISMIMQTTPPVDPDEVYIRPDHFTNDPFKIYKA